MTNSSTALTSDETETAGMDLFGRAVLLTAHMALTGLSRTRLGFVYGGSGAITSPNPIIEYIANSTDALAPSKKLTFQLDGIFRRAREIRFEDGMENELSQSLSGLLVEVILMR